PGVLPVAVPGVQEFGLHAFGHGRVDAVAGEGGGNAGLCIGVRDGTGRRAWRGNGRAAGAKRKRAGEQAGPQRGLVERPSGSGHGRDGLSRHFIAAMAAPTDASVSGRVHVMSPRWARSTASTSWQALMVW